MFETCNIVWEHCLSYISERMEYLKTGHRYSEESITDEIIYKIETAAPPDTLIYHAPTESKTGADIEWWLIDRTYKKAIVLRLQAKKLTAKGFYDSINRNIGNSKSKKQIDRLIGRAIRDRAIPLYCFYNYMNGIGSVRSTVNSIEECWTYADAGVVKHIIPKGAKPNLSINPSSIRPMKYIVDLICPTPLHPVFFSHYHLIREFVNNPDPSFRKRFKRYSRLFFKRILNTADFIRDEKELNIVKAAYQDQQPNPIIEAKYLLVTYIGSHFNYTNLKD